MGDCGFTSGILHSDRRGKPEHGALHKPVHTTVTFDQGTARNLVDLFQGKIGGYTYARQVNPTVSALQNKVTLMEKGLDSLVFATGMAAIGTSLFSLLRAGDHMISSAFLFGNTASLFNSLSTLGIDVTFVDATDALAVAAEIRDTTRLVFVETIANPCTQVSDLMGIGEVCREQGLVYIVDNTLTTPYLFEPRLAGASLVINSLTKYLGGHANALGGAVTELGNYDWRGYPNLYEDYRQGDAALWAMTQIRKKGLRDFGASLAADAAHRLSVGCDTLALRMERISSNAQTIANFLDAHPGVAKVYYPGLPEHPQHERSVELFRHFGGLLSVELEAGRDCFDFLDALDLVIKSTHLGDTRSLGIPVAHTIYHELGPVRRAAMGISDSLVRFSIGIEEPEDLLRDFAQALD